MLTYTDLTEGLSRKELLQRAKKQGIKTKKIKKKGKYEQQLAELQAELVRLEHWIAQKKLRVAILFEGRDAAGKGGAIKRFREHLNPRWTRIVALNKPTDVEKGQWYFRRYIKELPNPGEMVFFDRSWYNRAVVEPVMGFCTPQQYKQFMLQVPEFEHMLYEDGLILIKFWFSISKKEQNKRFESRKSDPLKQWKFSDVDIKGQKLWDEYTHHRDLMFGRTHTDFAPWVIVKTDDKRQARLESIRYVLSLFNYRDNEDQGKPIVADPNVVHRYYRSLKLDGGTK
jgi:polyphosphate kinase 2